jgi:hypothetical protein
LLCCELRSYEIGSTTSGMFALPKGYIQFTPVALGLVVQLLTTYPKYTSTRPTDQFWIHVPSSFSTCMFLKFSTKNLYNLTDMHLGKQKRKSERARREGSFKS